MGEKEPFLVRFWGVRGSYPVPGPRTVRHGGNTSCLEIEAGGHHLVLDCGSGIIRLGEQLVQQADEQPLHLALFITHGHNDHLQGLPFFAPLYRPQTSIDLFGPRLAERSIEQLVTPFVSPPYFPVEMRTLPSERAFHTLDDDACILWRRGDERPLLLSGSNHREQFTQEDVRIIAKFTTNHPLNGSLLYSIEYAGRRAIYATDIEWGTSYDEQTVAFLKGADLLIHDAQYTPDDYRLHKHGYGHSTYEMATEVARRASVGELVLFHHEPTYDDDTLDAIELEARRHFPRSRSAREGLEIDLFTSAGQPAPTDGALPASGSHEDDI